MAAKKSAKKNVAEEGSGLSGDAAKLEKTLKQRWVMDHELERMFGGNRARLANALVVVLRSRHCPELSPGTGLFLLHADNLNSEDVARLITKSKQLKVGVLDALLDTVSSYAPMVRVYRERDSGKDILPWLGAALARKGALTPEDLTQADLKFLAKRFVFDSERDWRTKEIDQVWPWEKWRDAVFTAMALKADDSIRLSDKEFIKYTTGCTNEELILRLKRRPYDASSFEVLLERGKGIVPLLRELIATFPRRVRYGPSLPIDGMAVIARLGSELDENWDSDILLAGDAEEVSRLLGEFPEARRNSLLKRGLSNGTPVWKMIARYMSRPLAGELVDFVLKAKKLPRDFDDQTYGPLGAQAASAALIRGVDDDALQRLTPLLQVRHSSVAPAMLSVLDASKFAKGFALRTLRWQKFEDLAPAALRRLMAGGEEEQETASQVLLECSAQPEARQLASDLLKTSTSATPAIKARLEWASEYERAAAALVEPKRTSAKVRRTIETLLSSMIAQERYLWSNTEAELRELDDQYAGPWVAWWLARREQVTTFEEWTDTCREALGGGAFVSAPGLPLASLKWFGKMRGHDPESLNHLIDSGRLEPEQEGDAWIRLSEHAPGSCLRRLHDALEVLERKDAEVQRIAAARCLRALGPAAETFVVELLQHRSQGLRELALNALMEHPTPRAIPHLAAALENKNSRRLQSKINDAIAVCTPAEDRDEPQERAREIHARLFKHSLKKQPQWLDGGGDRLLLASKDELQIVQLNDARTPPLHARVSLDAPFLSPDGAYLGQGDLAIETRLIEGGSLIDGEDFDLEEAQGTHHLRGGRILLLKASGQADGWLMLLNVRDGDGDGQEYRGYPLASAVNADESLLAVCSDVGELELFTLPELKRQQSLWLSEECEDPVDVTFAGANTVVQLNRPDECHCALRFFAIDTGEMRAEHQIKPAAQLVHCASAPWLLTREDESLTAWTADGSRLAELKVAKDAQVSSHPAGVAIVHGRSASLWSPPENSWLARFNHECSIERLTAWGPYSFILDRQGGVFELNLNLEARAGELENREK